MHVRVSASESIDKAHSNRHWESHVDWRRGLMNYVVHLLLIFGYKNKS